MTIDAPWLLRNTATALRHPLVGVDYVHWLVRRALGRPIHARGAFGTTLLSGAQYEELNGTRALVPGTAEEQMIRALSTAHPVFVDVGANVGQWTTALAAAHPAALVVAFEPAPSTLDLLRHNVHLNHLSNVRALGLALSDTIGIDSFQVAKRGSICNRLLPNDHRTATDAHMADAATISVETVRLDDYCQNEGIERIGFLKIDVEGAELRVLRGAERLLRTQAIDALYTEVEPGNLVRFGESRDTLAALLLGAGYAFHMLMPDGIPGPEVDIRERWRINMLALPRTRSR
jgi:FkbM family methyltransferase